MIRLLKNSSKNSEMVIFLFQRSLNVKEDGFRNLTLFLKSQMPVRWYLESWGLTGLLEVISNNGPVENHSLSSSQNLNITRKTLPSDFDQV